MASRVVHLSPIQWLHWSVAVNHRLSIRKFKLGECRELGGKNHKYENDCTSESGELDVV